MSAPDVPATSSPVSREFDILDEVTIEMPCQRCGGTYGGTARQILLAQDVLRCGGCQGKDDRECLPLAYADLVDVDSLRELDAAWRRLERHAVEHGCTVHLVAGRGN